MQSFAVRAVLPWFRTNHRYNRSRSLHSRNRRRFIKPRRRIRIRLFISMTTAKARAAVRNGKFNIPARSL
jgi:hypothetical protein